VSRVFARSRLAVSEWKAPTLSRSSPAFVKFTCAIAIFSDIFFYGLLPPILPSVLRDRVQIEPDQGTVRC
jgi:hypothetical protein